MFITNGLHKQLKLPNGCHCFISVNSMHLMNCCNVSFFLVESVVHFLSHFNHFIQFLKKLNDKTLLLKFF